MLTSSANQYLRPDHYLTPLPTTLDAKKSPLALLAQTCSQIGADPPSNKLLSSLDKASSSRSSKATEQSREKSSPTVTAPSGTGGESARTSFKPYESCLGREKACCTPDESSRSTSSHSTSGCRSRTPGNSGKRCPSNQSAASMRAVTPQGGRKSATPNGEVARDSPASRGSAPSGTADASASRPTASSPSLRAKPAYSPVSVLAMADPSIKDLPLGTFKPGVGLPVSTSAAAAAAYLGYGQLPIDAMANSLVSHHAMKNGINPYLYARLKTAGGGPADSLMPICRDPFCTGCQLNSHLLSNPATVAAAVAANVNGKLPSSAGSASGATPGAPCPAGCAQCDHKQPPGSVSPYGSLGAVYAAHAQLAALAAAGTQLPYVCNWIAGDAAYCGKRFATSEELLQHLRSHTSGAGDSANATVAAAAALSLLSPGPPPAALHPTHPLFARSYPTPPLSPLATARYHPYGKPSPLLTAPPSLSTLGLPLPPPPPPPPHPHATAGLAYFSPYSIYASRLGATSGMHQ